MSDEEQKRIFSKNLTEYLAASGKTQKEAADALGVITSTFNTWCQGIALPRMGKIQALADYFGIHKSDLLDEKMTEDRDSSYYLTDETRQIAREIFENPELHTLFEVAKDIPPARLRAYIEFMKSMSMKEPERK